MRDCWNALTANLSTAKCDVTLQSYLRLLGLSGTEPRLYLAKMKQSSLTFDDQMRLDRLLCFVPWNMIEGPAYRADDPKGPSDLDEYQSGLTWQEWMRQKSIRELFQAFQIFNAASSGNRVSPEAAIGVATVMNTVERTLLAGSLIRYRPEMWAEAKPPSGLKDTLTSVTWWRKQPGFKLIDRPR